MIRAAVCLLVAAGAIYAQGVPAGNATLIQVAGPKARLISGETMKLSAIARDNAGQARTGDVFTWSSSDPAVIEVDRQGSVKAKAFGFAEIRANLGNLRGAIFLQSIPSRVVVTPSVKGLFVGDKHQFRATALDVNGKEVPGTTFTWNIANAMLLNTAFASIDREGNVQVNGAGRLYVRARVTYPPQMTVPFVPYVEGVATLDVSLKMAYASKLIVAAGVSQEDSILRGRRSLLAVNDRGQIAFQGSLDSKATALMLLDGGQLTPLVTSGSPGPLPFGQIYEFQNFAFNDNGQVLTRALASGAPSGLLLASAQGSSWLGTEGMYSGGIEAISDFWVTRNSLNNQGQALVRAQFRIAGEAPTRVGLFRFNPNGTVDLVTSTMDTLPGISGPFTFDNDIGLANDGTVIFRVTSASGSTFFRIRDAGPEKLMGAGDEVAGARIASINGAAYPTFFVSKRGDMVVLAALSNNSTVLLHYPPGSNEPRTLSFRGLGGVFAMRDDQVLWYGDTGRGFGLQIWKGDGSNEPSLAVNQVVDGEPVTHIDGAGWSPQGEIVALVRTQTRPLVVVRAGEKLVQAGDTVRGTSALSFIQFVRGAKAPGSALLYGGGNPANLLELSATGVRPLVSFGERFDGNVVSPGFFGSEARLSADGALHLFVHPFGVNVPNFGVYRWRDGQVQEAVKLNFTWPDGTQQFAGSINSIANDGSLLLTGNTSRSHARLYIYRNGQPTLLATNSAAPEYETKLGQPSPILNWNDAVMTESGRVMANFRFANGLNGLFVHENGSWTEALVTGKTRVADRLVTTIVTIRAANESFYGSFSLAGGGSALAEWKDNAWKVLVSHNDWSPTGTPMPNIRQFDVNRRGEIVFITQGFNWNLLLARSPSGELSVAAHGFDTESSPVRLAQFMDLELRDDGTLYYLALDVSDRYCAFVATRR